MSETSSEPSTQELSSKIAGITLGLKWLCSVALLVLSLPNFLVSLLIGNFAQVFKDALPGKSLPGLTNFLIHDSSLLLISTFCWPLIGILALIYGKKPWAWIAVSLILGLIVFQIVATVAGLCMPMISMPAGMSDSPAH